MGNSDRSCCCLSSLLPAAAGAQMLWLEERDGCGSRDRNFKPNTGRHGGAGTFADPEPHRPVVISCKFQVVGPSSSLQGVEPGSGGSCMASRGLPGIVYLSEAEGLFPRAMGYFCCRCLHPCFPASAGRKRCTVQGVWQFLVPRAIPSVMSWDGRGTMQV